MSLLLLFLLSTAAARSDNTTDCDGHQANFDKKAVIGTWYVVAIIPGNSYPEDQKEVTCYKMDLSETEVAGLKWLVRKKMETPEDMVQDIRGTVIRQRYHGDILFDVWSRSVKGIKGCFRQVLALDTDKTEIGKAISHDATMQLHLIGSEAGPLLVQILWGRMISAVIYRRDEGVTQDQLKTVYNFMSKLRGTQRTPHICASSVSHF